MTVSRQRERVPTEVAAWIAGRLRWEAWLRAAGAARPDRVPEGAGPAIADPAIADPAIQVRGVRKRYGTTEALRGIDLVVGRGEVFGLLGPNGAGKTTTVEILEGFRRPSAGSVRVLGVDPAGQPLALRRRVGVVPQEGGLPRELTVGEVIEMFRSYFPAPLPADELLELVELTRERDQRVKSLSGGQRRRVEVAAALAGDPELVFLDEPTTGLDPGARRRAWAMIRDLAAHGRTVVLTTHYMEEAQTVADRVALLVDGRIVAQGPPATLRAGAAPSRIRFLLPPGVTADELVAVCGPVELEGAMVNVQTSEPPSTIGCLLAWAERRGAALEGLSVTPPSLEDTYLRLTDCRLTDCTVA